MCLYADVQALNYVAHFCKAIFGNGGFYFSSLSHIFHLMCHCAAQILKMIKLFAFIFTIYNNTAKHIEMCAILKTINSVHEKLS